ncbi:DUF4124 domain-containing protein [Caldimonas tepidiphila]|uniref:DUF4124 domain-containing protein n=1 Tax=Caldimonas tepidiphila TaxID=2315841 RepID=UPI000E5C468F|nr:DUF4124 domain-containing protein [Caldimonas tepidiphila]
MQPSRSFLFALALAAAALSMPASAQWKWRDAQGKVQYSDLPPPAGVPDSDILRLPNEGAAARAAAGAGRVVAAPAQAASAPAQKASGSPLDKEVEARRKAEEQAAEARRKAEEQRAAKERAEHCNRGRGQLRALESGERLSRTNDSGEREILDDAQRTEEIARLRRSLALNCK